MKGRRPCTRDRLAHEYGLDIITLHIDALYVILAQHITGQGGAIEAQVLTALQQATKKFN